MVRSWEGARPSVCGLRQRSGATALSEASGATYLRTECKVEIYKVVGVCVLLVLELARYCGMTSKQNNSVGYTDTMLVP